MFTPLNSSYKRTPFSPTAQAALEKHLPRTSSLLNCKSSVISRKDASCITDLCSSEHLPEVEIFSLLEEQIPKYKIRSDPITNFSGYDNQDWFVSHPTLQLSEDGLGLNKDQIREALNYFYMSGERVSQTTKVYDDSAALTHLLEEKKKDLELTVQIGKELLIQNGNFEKRVVRLESDLKQACDNMQQLKHDLDQKTNIIAILTDNPDGILNADNIDFSTLTVDMLEQKIASLRDENAQLKQDTTQLVRDADLNDEKEKQVMEDIIKHLNSTNFNVDELNLELEHYKEDNSLLQEQIKCTKRDLADVELKLQFALEENNQVNHLLGITKENQNVIATELAEFKIRYQEMLSLLNETQERLRNSRKLSQQSSNRTSFICSQPIAQAGSLQSELMETSMFSENSVDSGIADANNYLPYKKVFDTVRCVSKSNPCINNTGNDMLYLGTMSMSSSSQPRMTSSIQSTDELTLLPHLYPGSTTTTFSKSLSMSGNCMGTHISSVDSLLESDNESTYPAHAPPGCPGVPGAKDLEAALNRLTPGEIIARRAMLSHAPAGSYNYNDENSLTVPQGCRTPDSIMSAESFSMIASSRQQYHWRLPEKLQIVKPMEGSQTLKHWNRLATPTLSGLLEERPGVTIRGGRGLDDLGLQTYSLSDCEEDFDDNPGKRFPSSGCIFTFTNSTVMHPDDGTSSIATMSRCNSQVTSRMTSRNVSQQSSACITPRSSRRNSCSTFSVNLGLASMLNERGIKAVTPSALNTPCGINYSPTSTPCNSPEGSSSPLRHVSPEPQFLAGFLTSGAELIRKKIIGDVLDSKQKKLRAGNTIMLSRLEKRALKSIKILEKVENMGLDRMVATTIANVITQLPTMHVNNPMYSSRSSSPMTQLTSLKKLNTSETEEVHINKETIKAVLSKGWSCDATVQPEAETSSKAILESCKNNEPTAESSLSVNKRLKQLQRQKSRRHIKNGGQRPDLGTVGASTSTKLFQSNSGTAPNQIVDTQSIGFIGTLSSLLFGRKGGLL